MKKIKEHIMTGDRMCLEMLDIAIDEMGDADIADIATVMFTWMIDKEDGDMMVAGICAHAIKRLRKQATVNN